MWPADYKCLRHACCLPHFLIYQGRSARIDPGAGTRQTTGQILFLPLSTQSYGWISRCKMRKLSES